MQRMTTLSSDELKQLEGGGGSVWIGPVVIDCGVCPCCDKLEAWVSVGGDHEHWLAYASEDTDGWIIRQK